MVHKAIDLKLNFYIKFQFKHVSLLSLPY